MPEFDETAVALGEGVDVLMTARVRMVDETTPSDHIVHDWPDGAALQILRNVRRAAPTGAALLLVETVIPEDNREFIGKFADIEMWCSTMGVNAPPRSISASMKPVSR